jgi:AcrR family transcriptional regulator
MFPDIERACQDDQVGVYGGVAAVDRQAGRRARLLQAALELSGHEGWRATTIRGVCGRAGLTPRYFYESFADREALLIALFDELAAGAAAAVLAALPGAASDARENAQAAIAAFVDYLQADPRRARVLFIEALGSEALAQRRFESVRMFAGLVADQARRFYGLPDEPAADVEISSLMLVGGLAETLLAWLDGTLAATREELVAEVAEVFVATAERAMERRSGRD